MFCLNCNPIVSLSPEGRHYVRVLKYLNYFYIIVTFFKLVLGDVNGFFNDFLTIFMLILTFMQANFVVAMIVIFILLMQTFYTLIFLLLILQNSYFGFVQINSLVATYLFLVVVSLFLYILLTYYTFLAYREFKALFKEQSQHSSSYNYRKIFY
jgi:hypothetical protein